MRGCQASTAKLRFRRGGDGPSIDISADQIISSLNFAFLGSLEGRKGPWGVATDVIYLDLGGSAKASSSSVVFARCRC